MKEDVIRWSDLIRVPDPETTLTIFLHLLVHYWRAENSPDYYRSHVFPRDVGSVLLRVDHPLYKKVRYHLYEVEGGDRVGVWDETPYHVGFGPDHAAGFDHGDYRHDFQMFLRSFWKEIRPYAKHYPLLDRLSRVLAQYPLLEWKCNVCRLYNDWSRKFIGSVLLEQSVSIAPSSLLHLLTYSNKKMGVFADVLQDQCAPLEELMVSALGRFFVQFEKIHEQTSAEPVSILGPLIDILEKYTAVYTTDQIHEFEHQCARDMKDHLYGQFKFLRTKSIQVHHFPRDMMIARDIFAMVVGIWGASSPATPHGSPGVLVLLYNMLFPDRALGRDFDATQPLVVFHPLEDTPPMTRHMTPAETQALTDYHPLLRQTLFKV